MTELTLGAKLLGFFKGVPSWVYIALAVAALIGAGAFLHHRAVKSAYDAAYKAGGDAEAARIEKAAKKLEAQANAVTAKIRSKNDETNRRITSDANSLRLRGAGKAACPDPATTFASGHVSAGGAADAAVDQVPDPERLNLIAMPFDDALAFAEQSDRLRAEVISTREQHQALSPSVPPQE